MSELLSAAELDEIEVATRGDSGPLRYITGALLATIAADRERMARLESDNDGLWREVGRVAALEQALREARAHMLHNTMEPMGNDRRKAAIDEIDALLSGSQG